MDLEALALFVALLGPLDEMSLMRSLEASFFGSVDPAKCTVGGSSQCGSGELRGGPPSVLAPAVFSTRGLEKRLFARSTSHPRLVNLQGLTVPVELNARVNGFLDFFQTRGKHIYARWFARKGRFAKLITGVLDEYGLPRELIYVCMIESGFNPEAVSRASAVGPWQFVRSTAQDYGLRHDAWIDARRDPVKSTHAAARHFRDLYSRYHSWPMALAAYNAGVGNVARAIRRADSNDFWVLADAGTLPDEATRYVPKAMAAMIVGNDPDHFGFGDVVPEPAAEFAVVMAPAGVDVRAVAKQSGVSNKQLEALNPELRRGFTPPDEGDYPLRVPSHARDQIVKVLDRAMFKNPRVFVEHTVRFGERLNDVGRLYGISTGGLRRLNELPSGNALQPGKVLIVPGDGRRAAVSDSNELMVVIDPGIQFRVNGRQEIYFPVRRATRVADVATFFDVAPGDVGMWNGVDPMAKLHKGMVLRLFVRADFDMSTALAVPRDAVTVVAAGSDGANKALAQAARKRQPNVKRITHTVKRGESLWSIAKRYKTTVRSLRGENGLGVGRKIPVGTGLVVPVQRAAKPKGLAARRRAKSGSRGRKYRVRSGDSLWKIARRFGTTVAALRKRNRLRRRALLQPGQVIRIPK